MVSFAACHTGNLALGASYRQGGRSLRHHRPVAPGGGAGCPGSTYGLPLLPECVAGRALRVHGGDSAGYRPGGLVSGLAGDIGRGVLFGALARTASVHGAGYFRGLSAYFHGDCGVGRAVMGALGRLLAVCLCLKHRSRARMNPALEHFGRNVMSCCGKKRAAAAHSSAVPVAGMARLAPFPGAVRRVRNGSGSEADEPLLRYLGEHPISLNGPRSGRVYYFAAAGYQLPVHADDVEALLRTRQFERGTV